MIGKGYILSENNFVNIRAEKNMVPYDIFVAQTKKKKIKKMFSNNICAKI